LVRKKLKAASIKTIHYVGPSIWAWRPNRIHGIKRAVSHVLALFPFEPKIYQNAGIPVTYVGHPLADMLPLKPDVLGARESLKLKSNSLIITMLPGSRQSEVKQHVDLFIQTAKLILNTFPQAQFLVPLITRETRHIFELALFHEVHLLPMQILFGHAHEAIEASDVVIVASGTATLEAALLKNLW